MPHSVPVRKIRWMQRDMGQKWRKIRRNQSTAVHLGVRLPAAASTAIGGHHRRRASLVVVTVPPGIALRRGEGAVAGRGCLWDAPHTQRPKNGPGGGKN